ncbi:MAG: hypothetical protein M1365_11970 [Actinobacteria bacterium]|nr:hypothetical protein [Actinomycetota bacterium]
MNKIIKRALVDSFGTALYIVLVVSFLFSLQAFNSHEDIMLIPVAMLLLFVSSAAITGFLVFGKPVMLYIDGKKREAVMLLGYTLCILVLITIFAFISLGIYFSLF